MDNIEQEEKLQDDYNIQVPLAQGLDLNALKSGDGVDIILKEQDFDDNEEEDNHYSEELISTLSSVCMGEGSDDDDDDDDMTPFERLAKKMMDITPDGSGGVMKKVLTQGTGKVVQHQNRVVIHFSSYLEYSDEPFDSSRLRKKCEKFILGKNEVIEGMELAVSTMRRGERSRFLINSEFAYGPMGCPPRIPRNANIMMEIELIDFSEAPLVEDFNSLPERKKREASFDTILHVARVEKEEATKMYNTGNIKKAQDKYLKSQQLLDNAHMRDEKDEEEMKKVMLKLCLNIAQCSLKLAQPRRTIHNCKRALEIERGNVRALYRLGLAFLDMDDFKEAEKYLCLAQSKQPHDKHINTAMQKLAKRKRDIHLMETDVYSKMFKDLNTVGRKPDKEGTEKESSTDPGTCPPEIQRAMKDKLRSFKESAGSVEPLLLQISQMASAEVQFVKSTAIQLGLDVRTVEKVNEKCLKISIPETSQNT